MHLQEYRPQQVSCIGLRAINSRWSDGGALMTFSHHSTQYFIIPSITQGGSGVNISVSCPAFERREVSIVLQSLTCALRTPECRGGVALQLTFLSLDRSVIA